MVDTRGFAALFSSFMNLNPFYFKQYTVLSKQSLISLLCYYLMTGYSTHMVGKWHLGFFKWPYTPTYRGFDSFYGLYTGHADHYKYDNEGFLDLRDNEVPVKDKEGVYSTRLFTEVTSIYFKFKTIM